MPTLRTAFPENIDDMEARLKNMAASHLRATVERVKQDVVALGKEMITKEAQERIARMLVKGHAIATELRCMSAFQKGIQKVLEKGLNDEGRYIIGISLESMAAGHGRLGDEKGGDEATEIARAIIDSFPAFKNFNVKLFNAKASGVTFEHALSRLQCVPVSPDPKKSGTLQQAFAHYSATYSAEVNKIVKSLQTYPVEQTKERIVALATQLRPHATALSKHAEQFGELLGLVCAAWTYLSCSEGGKYSGAEKSSVLQPHATQILGILRLLALDHGSLSNHLIQINTGEGKSIALGFTAVILATLGFSVDVVCYSRYLCERDCKAFAGLFQLLGQQAHIAYNDFNSLSSRIMHNGVHLPEVRATFRRFLQGDNYKSKKRVRAGSGDEGDSDDDEVRPSAKHARQARQARRGGGGKGKAKRGRTAGKEVKEEEEGEEEDAASGGGRGGGFSFGGAGPSSKKARGGGKTVVKRGPSAAVPCPPMSKARPSVLLLDEVDVFFGEGFYGAPYRPCIDLESSDGFNLLLFLWHNRDMFPRTKASVAKLMARHEAANLQRAFPNLSPQMLEREMDKMLDAVQRFPKGGAPKLRGGEQEYTIQAHKKRICYIDPASGVPCPSISYGYVTSFTYLQCEEHGRLTMEAVRAHVKLQPVCGTFSYSQIPTFYDYCLGMTGTLGCLTREQNTLLESYGFRKRTFLPSTFDKKTINAAQDIAHASTLVVHGSYDEYFATILDDITRELKLGRAILVVFADCAKLQRFSAAIHKTSPNLPQYTPPLELSDHLSNDERASVVMQAIRRY
jgi:hypothetical protein